MNINRETVMTDIKRAERIKKTLLSNGTYDEMAERTGIGAKTLLRMATGKTEPKFADIIEIAKVTGTSLDWIAHGDLYQSKNQASNDTQVLHFDEEATANHYYIIWNLKKLHKNQVNAIAEQVKALDAWNYSRRDQQLQSSINGWHLVRAIGNDDLAGAQKIISKLTDDYALNESEIVALVKNHKDSDEKIINILEDLLSK